MLIVQFCGGRCPNCLSRTLKGIHTALQEERIDGTLNLYFPWLLVPFRSSRGIYTPSLNFCTIRSRASRICWKEVKVISSWTGSIVKWFWSWVRVEILFLNGGWVRYLIMLTTKIHFGINTAVKLYVWSHNIHDRKFVVLFLNCFTLDIIMTIFHLPEKSAVHFLFRWSEGKNITHNFCSLFIQSRTIPCSYEDKH